MSILIIDISSHQILSTFAYDELSKVIDGVILRVAYGIAIRGKPGPDPLFYKHYDEFSKRGVPIGAYHYICEWCTARDQANLMANSVKDKDLKLGIWCDVEVEPEEMRLTEKTVNDYMMYADDLVGKLDIYTGFYHWKGIMINNPNRYSDRKLWLAAYTPSPTPYIPKAWSSWWLWQYTSKGGLPGYSRDLDKSKFFGTQDQFDLWIGNPTNFYQIPLPKFSQRDPQWSGIKLGTSQVTIGNYGCLITSVASILKYLGKSTDPKTINSDLIRVGGYLNENLLIFSKISDIYPDVYMTNHISSGISMLKIDYLLGKNIPVIVQIDYNPLTTELEQHWVVIVGKSYRGYKIMDPWTGEIIEFSDKYGNPENHIFRIVTYELNEEDEMLFQAKCLVSSLRIRSTPSNSSDSNLTGGVMTYGKIYVVFEVSGDWYRVGLNQWVLSKLSTTIYMQKVAPAPLTYDQKTDILVEAHPDLFPK